MVFSRSNTQDTLKTGKLGPQIRQQNIAVSSRFVRRFLTIGALCLSASILPYAQASALDDNALPSGGVIIGGNAGFDYSIPNELHIQQSSDRAVINWNSFNIGKNALTQFHQNSSSAIAVNRVTGNNIDPTQILGTLKANGRVIVLDNNGVIFGRDSVVDVGGIVASTGNIDDVAFLRGDRAIKIKDADKNGIALNGQMTVADAGLAAFVAPSVVNNGIITARMGRVELAGATSATVDLYGDGLTEVAVDADQARSFVSNTGIINAEGGTVKMTAAAAKKIVDASINMSGVIRVGSVSQKGGKIILSAEGSNAVKNNVKANKGKKSGRSTVTIDGGYLDASGYGDAQSGGSVEITGDAVGIFGSLIDASGDAGGGSIKIGGDYLGTGTTSASLLTIIDARSLILNNAVSNGNGGRTIVWSDGNTGYYGSIFGRGGQTSGNGGFVETSGHNYLDAQGYVDLLANHGDKGTYLLDPTDITIFGNVDPTFVSTNGDVNLSSNLKLWLDATSLSSLTTGDTVSTWLDKSGNGNNALATGSLPVYIANGANGRPTVYITGANGFRTLHNLGITGNEPRTESFVFSQSVPGSTNLLGFGASGGGNINDIILYGGTIIGHFYGGGYDTIGGSPAFALNTLTQGLLTYNGAQVNLYKDGIFGNSRAMGLNTIDSQALIGSGAYASYNGFTGNVSEIVLYDKLLSNTELSVFNQYQSAKWGIALDPNISTSLSEASEAMDASSGYSTFTTRYLERLSQTANINLVASNNINFDLKGDTLDLANNRNFSLNAGNNITSLSAGTVKTNGTGNITFTAGGLINTDNFTLNASGSGSVNLNATNAISLTNSRLTSSTGAINLTAGGAVNYTSPEAITVDTVSGSSVLLRTTGTAKDIRANGLITATGSGNAAVLAATGKFVNGYGADLFNLTGGGRWLVYSANPSLNTRNGLTPNAAAIYGGAYGTMAPGAIAAGNRFVFSDAAGSAPVITFTADNKTKTYGDVNGTLTYTSSGYIDADTSSTAFTGSVGLSTLLDQTSGAGTHNNEIVISSNGLATNLGYQFAFDYGDYLINKADLAIIANNLSKNYSFVKSLTGNEFTASGLKNLDGVNSVVLNSAGTLASANLGVYDIAISGAVGTGLANYTITYGPGLLTVLPYHAPPTSTPAVLANIASQLSAVSSTTSSNGSEKSQDDYDKMQQADVKDVDPEAPSASCIIVNNVSGGCALN